MNSCMFQEDNERQAWMLINVHVDFSLRLERSTGKDKCVGKY